METNIHKITYLGKSVEVIQWQSESNKQFATRLEYIRKCEAKSLSFNDAMKLSNVWHCIKYRDCSYPSILKQKVTNI